MRAAVVAVALPETIYAPPPPLGKSETAPGVSSVVRLCLREGEEKGREDGRERERSIISTGERDAYGGREGELVARASERAIRAIN